MLELFRNPNITLSSIKKSSIPNIYTQLYVQIIFAVQGRQHFITENIREEVQKYMAGIIDAKHQKLYAIYCMPTIHTYF